MVDSPEYQESTTIRFEWTLRGLKSLFETSKGKTKSKVTKSMKFGGSRWQILFYANSGTTNTAAPPNGGTSTNEDEEGFVSLYLSCEPTSEERSSAVNGKWVRDGVYKFGFELRNVHRTVLFNNKEAHDHSFSYKTVNWGWAQFARRDSVYYQPHSVKTHDAFLIVCTITSSPSPPTPSPTVPRHPVPRDLLDAVGSLLDDPVYSDVEFVLPRRGRSIEGARTIKAAKRLLQRVDYFDTMFNSGFAEANDHSTLTFGTKALADLNEDLSPGASIMSRHFEDSDDEDEELFLDADEDHGLELSDSDLGQSRTMTAASAMSTVLTEDESDDAGFADTDDGEQRNVRQKLTHPSSPRHSDRTMNEQESVMPSQRRMARVVVQDASFSTYKSILYYIYTDSIEFAPLSSSFITHAQPPPPQPNSIPPLPPTESQMFLTLRAPQAADPLITVAGPKSRREWIKDWEASHPGRPTPCSAKAVYRLADKLDLSDLKARSFSYIIKSLTVDNVPYEVFSTFSAAFEEVRKVQVKYFLDNWTDIRGSDAMRNVWQQIRLGRHPGYEEVWPVIAQNLEFKPHNDTATGDETMREI